MIFWSVNLAMFFTYLGFLKKMRKDMVFLLVACIHLTFIAAMRDISVGTDTSAYSLASNYLYLTERVYPGAAMSSAPVFIAYIKFVYKLYHGYNMYIIATAIPCNLCIFYFIYKKSRNYYESVCLYLTTYFYFFSFNVARQMLAISLILICYCLVNEHKYIRSFVLFLLAVGIHSSTSIFFFYFCVHFIKLNSRKTISIVALVGIAFMALEPLLYLFTTLFPNYKWMLTNYYASKYSSLGRTAIVSAFYCLVTVCIYTYSILYNEGRLRIKFIKEIEAKDVYEVDKKEIFALIFILSTVAIVEFMYPNYILFQRMLYVYYIFLLIGLPNALDRIKGKKVIAKCIIYIPLTVMMAMQLLQNYSVVLNYTVYKK